MKILISTEEGALFFYFKSVIRALCCRGHRVHVMFAKHFDDWVFQELKSFGEEFPSFTFGHSFYRSNPWRNILRSKRVILAYRRHLISHDRREISSFYRDRLKKFFPWWLKPLILLPIFNINFIIKSETCGRFLDYLERSAPPDPKIAEQIKGLSSDLVLVSVPCDLISATPDYDYLGASKALGLPNALFLVGWDNLEVKGKIHLIPDSMFVWNEIQQNSAVMKHGVPREKTRIVGAPFYDNFFDENLKPSVTREEFCKLHDLDPARPIFLYMGSSSIYGDETWVVRLFRKALDNSENALLKSAQIFIRPHPSHKKFWKLLRLKKEKDFKVQTGSAVPGLEEVRRDYYDTLYYSSAIAGICTSGFIHAFIMGKPVISYLTSHYDMIQNQAPHWRQLKESDVLEIVQSGEEFAATLGNLLRGVDPRGKKRAEFIQKYVRPCGIEREAGEVWADEIEKLSLVSKSG